MSDEGFMFQASEPSTQEGFMFTAKPRPRARPRPSAAQDIAATLATFNAAVPFADEFADAAQAVVNAATGRSRGLAQGWQQARQASQEAIRDLERRRPVVANLARGTGLAASAALPGGAAAQTSRAGAAALGAAGTAAQAGLQAAADRGTVRERLQAANRVMTDPLTLALGAGLGAAGIPARELPRRRVRPEVLRLAEEGVQMTPGQIRGGMARKVESLASSAPILGQAIDEARQRSVETFNRAAINRALRPIGETLPEGMAAGREAIGFAQERIGRAFNDVNPQVSIMPDDTLRQEMQRVGQIAQDLTPDRAAQLQNMLGQRITSRIADRTAIGGEDYQRIRSELGNLARQYSSAPDPDVRSMGQALQAAQEALDNAAARQNAGLAPALAANRQAYAALVPVEAASVAGTSGGVFTPRQLSQALRRADRSVRKRATAGNRGGRMDFADAAVDVLPANVANSGTADRTSLLGLAALTGVNPVAGLATAGGLGLAARGLYSEQAIAAANRALNERISREARLEALQELGLLAEQNPALRQLYADLSARLSRGGGAFVGAQTQPTAAGAMPQ